MYYVRCYYKNSVCCYTGHKTKRSATNRYNNAISSKCFDKVELVFNNEAVNVFDFALNY